MMQLIKALTGTARRLAGFALVLLFIPASVLAERTLTIDGSPSAGEVRRFWQVSNYAKRDARTFAQKTDTEEFFSRAPFAREVVVDYALGGHTPDGEEYYLGQGPNGELITNFTGLIQRIDGALEAGLTPWIGLENVPSLMSDPVNWSVYGNSNPAKDNVLFQRYVTLAMKALIKAFGRKEMASWKFIVATEPDLYPAHWTGTRDEFMDLLDHTLKGVFEVLPEAQISPGNILNPSYYHKPSPSDPAKGDNLVRSRNQWGLDIIDHMAAGSINPGTGPGNKMDFFSFSWYGRVGASPDMLDRAVQMIRDRLAPYPQYRGMPIDVREFGILVDEHRHRLYAGDASEWGASFYAAIARRVYDLNIRNVFEWDSATAGVLHPRGQVIRMLDQMAGGASLKVRVTDADSEQECNAIACRKEGSLFVLVYNHHDQRVDSAVEQVHLRISDPLFATTRQYSLTEWTIDRNHASWIHAFLEDAAEEGLAPLPDAGQFEGSPYRLLGEKGPPLFTANIEKYRKLARLPETRHADAIPLIDGSIQMDVAMPGHSVRLIRLTPDP